MRDIEESLKIALTSVQTAIRDGRYFNAGQLATDFIKLSSQVEYKRGVFIGEMLESICLQLDAELSIYVVPEPVQNELQANIVKHMGALLTAYESHGNTFDVLEDMRYYVTVFQFTTRTQYKQRPPTRPPSRRE